MQSTSLVQGVVNYGISCALQIKESRNRSEFSNMQYIGQVTVLGLAVVFLGYFSWIILENA
jgi:hypothetical protein